MSKKINQAEEIIKLNRNKLPLLSQYWNIVSFEEERTLFIEITSEKHFTNKYFFASFHKPIIPLVNIKELVHERKGSI